MNILDENIIEPQRDLLRKWGVAVRQIGYEVAWLGIKDDGIIPVLHQLHHTTLFTRDVNFYKRELRYANYCVVFLAVREYETAAYVRRVLRHPDFNTEAKRMGTVIRAEPSGVTVWRLHAEQEVHIAWPR